MNRKNSTAGVYVANIVLFAITKNSNVVHSTKWSTIFVLMKN